MWSEDLKRLPRSQLFHDPPGPQLGVVNTHHAPPLDHVLPSPIEIVGEITRSTSQIHKHQHTVFITLCIIVEYLECTIFKQIYIHVAVAIIALLLSKGEPSCNTVIHEFFIVKKYYAH